MRPHYSGPLSRAFWKRVNALKGEPERRSLYTAGVLLQNMESDVLRYLKNAEAMQPRKGRGAARELLSGRRPE